ncbi:DNA alkylation repair protein [Carnobacterium viridans]|uniref:3-methyladenine DNA glycosylase AlkD n=1 Tax=Carnobacterium viridans TaxID=174587 RepID=A0A1H0YK82_9LACT|nr:DNA alkylation repair protein [Carnobacterium viridans]SDQ15587.1 3-methyladenine DNA glycosylase AlkD [Carnobacterium viridans]
MDKYRFIKDKFEKISDRDKADSMAKYMRNRFQFYGIPSPKRRETYKEFIREEKKNKTTDWDFLDKCYGDEHREFQYLVLDYLIAMNKELKFEDIPRINKYIKVKQWWDTIDFFNKIIGNIGLRDRRVDSLMLEWSEDEDFWVRRLAINHQLGRKEKTKTALLEEIITNNFGSDEFFINKAIGWSLRDYSKVNPEWVRVFINKYSDEMSNLSIREASKYL